VNNREGSPLRLGGELAPETAAQEGVDHGVQTLLGEAVPVRFGIPYVDVPEAALGALDDEMDDEPFGWLIAETFKDPAVGSGIDRDVLGERVTHFFLHDLIRS